MKIAEYKKKYGGQPILVSPGVMETKLNICLGAKILHFQPYHKYPRGKTPVDETGFPVQYLPFNAYIWEDEGTLIRDKGDFLVCRDNGECLRQFKKEHNL